MLSQVAIADPDASVESLRAAHERVLASGAQQERLIEALLTLARGQAGLDRREPADLAAIAGQAAATRQAQARSLGLRLRTALGPASAQGSPGLVERLITNLLDNAITHNVMGGWVEVMTTAERGRGIVSVANTGPVIPPAVVEELVRPFRQHDTDLGSQREGVGLGLSIVAAIAEAHDAEMAICPRPGGGLRVQVSFREPAS